MQYHPIYILSIPFCSFSVLFNSFRALDSHIFLDCFVAFASRHDVCYSIRPCLHSGRCGVSPLEGVTEDPVGPIAALQGDSIAGLESGGGFPRLGHNILNPRPSRFFLICFSRSWLFANIWESSPVRRVIF